MTGRAGRLLLVLMTSLVGGLVGAPLFGGPSQVGLAVASTDGANPPTTCSEISAGWSEIGVDLESADPPVEPGRVFHLSDGTIAVLVVVTATGNEGEAMSLDFSASVRLAAAIIRAGDTVEVIPFDPPRRNGSGLAAPDEASIDSIAFCYRIQVPNPPEPGATEEAETPEVEVSPTEVSGTSVPRGTATATPGSFEVGAVQTANALATEAADAQATIVAGEATREAESAAAEATIAAVEATASAEVAAAQATSAALATADADRQNELATAQAVQTEAAATIAALQAATEVPSPTATPSESSFYSVPADGGFDTWAVPAGWTVSDGVLVNDGGDFTGYVQPPRTVDRDNYAIEAEIRIAEEPACASNFGLLVRGTDTGFYAGGIEWVCDAGASARIWALSNVLAQDNRTVDQDWHTYRVAVNGDQITVSIDGVQVLQATDAGFPTGGQVALWSNKVKLEVRAFRVLVTS